MPLKIAEPSRTTPPSIHPTTKSADLRPILPAVNPTGKSAEPGPTLFQESELLDSDIRPAKTPAKPQSVKAGVSAAATSLLGKPPVLSQSGATWSRYAKNPFVVGTILALMLVVAGVVYISAGHSTSSLAPNQTETIDQQKHEQTSTLPSSSPLTSQSPTPTVVANRTETPLPSTPQTRTTPSSQGEGSIDKKLAARIKCEQAEQAIRRHDLAAARTLAAEAESLNPLEAAAYNVRGEIFRDEQRLSRAEAEFRAALSGDPNYKDAQDNLAALLANKSRTSAPSSTPARQQEPRLSAAEVQDFVRHFVSANQAEEADMALSTYATDVRYFDEGRRDHDYIRNDVEKYFERWPIRRGSIEGEIAVTESVAGQEYSASFKQDFYAENAAGEWSKGEVAIQMEVMATWNGPKIFGISQQMLQREKGKNAVHAPPLTTNGPKLLQAPRPTYPREAEQRGETGSGRFKIEFDDHGNAKSVTVVQSTGSKILDANTINTLKNWHAVAGHPGSIVVPITYTKPNRPARQPSPSANFPTFPTQFGPGHH